MSEFGFQPQEDDDSQQQLEAESYRMQEELDCLRVVYSHGLEGTASILAVHLGISNEWKQLREQLERRAA